MVAGRTGQATFVGALTGSFLGLVALLLGALFNASLNRKRDDRLRREDQQAVASALAELEGLQPTLKHQAEIVSQEDYAKPDEEVNVPDLGQSIRIMPEALSKLVLLDGKTIGARGRGLRHGRGVLGKAVAARRTSKCGPRKLQAPRGVAVKASDASRSTE